MSYNLFSVYDPPVEIVPVHDHDGGAQPQPSATARRDSVRSTHSDVYSNAPSSPSFTLTQRTNWSAPHLALAPYQHPSHSPLGPPSGPSPSYTTSPHLDDRSAERSTPHYGTRADTYNRSHLSTVNHYYEPPSTSPPPQPAMSQIYPPQGRSPVSQPQVQQSPSYHSHDPHYDQGYDNHGGRSANTYPNTPPDEPDYTDYTAGYHHGGNDFADDYKSYDSHTHLPGAAAKEYDVGAIVPSQGYNNTPAPTGSLYGVNTYPPSPMMGGGQLPASPGFSGSSHWHAARENLLARRVVKQIPLFNGNLVMDVPVPRPVIPTSTGAVGAEPGEMEKMRYSAATCDPDDFLRRKFNLRPYLYGRRTELFVVMTMYNEDGHLFLRTLNAVIKNINHLNSRTRSKTWGVGAWKKVVVCIVADGRKVCDTRVLKILQLMGVYAEGVAKDTVAGKEVQAHIFEYTSQIIVSDTGEVGFGGTPVQYIFCLKEANKKKLNSHRWFFNAFGPQIKPNVCILLDVGTKPSGTSLYDLYKVFEKHKNVGGACGEIYADTGKWGRLLLNPLVAGQNFEYKMSNILDKPFESVFGLISVLPGAFSAYRYAAVCNHPDGTGPLASYFHGELMNLPGAPPASIFDRNKFLAEDRILAFEIVTKKNAKWRLQYVKSAKASTDVPARVPEFISQRRRWLNGSIFASFYALYSFWRIWTSGHNIIRKLVLQFLTVYNLINLIFNWLSVSSFYLAFYFLIDSSISGAKDPFGGAGSEIFQIFNKVYIGIIFVVLICSLGNRPQGANFMYTLCILLFAACQGILLYCAGWTVYQTVPHTADGWRDWRGLFSNRTFLSLAMSLMATYGLYIISSLMYLDPWHMLTSFIQYLFLLPSYVNILLIYAFCNLHDVSWGTKGDNGNSKDLGQAKTVKKNGEEMAEVALPTRQEDVEALWQQARSEMRIPPKEVKEKRSAETKRSDSDRNFRTNVVLLFLGSNMLVIMLFTSSAFTDWLGKHFVSATESTFNPYLTAIFYSVLFLSVMRFIGCLLYLIFRFFGF